MLSKKEKVAAVSILASGGTALAKFVVGVAIGSLALISDALHSTIDLIATIITWIVVRIADRPADAEHHYGHGKLESLSALGVTAMLYVLAGGILVEAYSRLSEGAPPVTLSAIPFVVLIVEMAVNFWRARVLHRTAMETKSHALEADSLHFASDMYGSVAVMIGLILTGFGFSWGDAAAAIAVALIISILGLKLARSTIEALLDRAPEGAGDLAQAALIKVPGILAVERLRVRNVGPKHFVDAIVHVPRTFAISRIDAIKKQADEALDKALGDADLTLTATPIAHDNESVRDRIMVVARNRSLAIHHVTVHNLGDKLTIGIDLEVDGKMPLRDAHEKTRELETAIRMEFGENTEVDTHIEPLQPDMLHGTEASADKIRHVAQALIELAAQIGAVQDVHNVRVRDTEDGEVINFHCRVDPALPVSAVHDRVDEIERGLRARLPSIKRVISHAEPRRN